MRKTPPVFLIAALVAHGLLGATARPTGNDDAVVQSRFAAANRASAAAARPSVQAVQSVERNVQSRSAVPGAVAPASRSVAGRSAVVPAVSARPSSSRSGAAVTPRAAARPAARGRAAVDDAVAAPSTRIGAAYDQCKNSYFACMDQFCAVKNEKYRRCSCSDKIYELDDQQQVLESAAVQINEFNSGLDAVGMTAAQAAAMRKASEGELAMGADKSASKRILNAIISSISGSGETKVGGGGLEQLNSLTFQTGANPFGGDDTALAMASYNGTTLYTAIFGQCRNVVRDSCPDDALQRAVTAYLMAVENDCNVVQKMIEDNRKKMTSAARESSAMLSLARIESRQNQNSLNVAECLDAVEAAIKDEQVCGANYKKCLDNGEFINKDTGKPFTGVTSFYKLAEILTFNSGANINDQKLTQIPNNRIFVQNFTARNKKFAEGPLGKCVESADTVWGDYLDKAMLEIYYAQKAKVDEIKRGCFDFVRECYVDGRKAVTDFMRNLVSASGAALMPETVSLTSMLCESYVESCNKMFDGDVVADYIKQVDDKDILTTCRNVAKECFDTYGGTQYNNFYNPGSGIFKIGQAMDWFTLYEYEWTGAVEKKIVKSACAKKLMEIAECSSDEKILEKVFGGVDKISANIGAAGMEKCYEYGLKRATVPSGGDSRPECVPPKTTNDKGETAYVYSSSNLSQYINPINMRETGVATEVYNNVVGKLQTNCKNFFASFVEYRYMDPKDYCRHNTPVPTGKSDPCLAAGVTPCVATFASDRSGLVSQYTGIARDYNFPKWEDGANPGENLCPAGYANTVDTMSWGICSCWANGGRRMMWSSNGAALRQTCQVYIPGIFGREPVTNTAGQVCPINVWIENSQGFEIKDGWLNDNETGEVPNKSQVHIFKDNLRGDLCACPSQVLKTLAHCTSEPSAVGGGGN